MTKKVEAIVESDPVLKRWRATCPICGRKAVRAKREAVKHYMDQHLAYDHGVQTS